MLKFSERPPSHPRQVAENQTRIEALRAALIAGEISGAEPCSFDVEAFLQGKRQLLRGPGE